MPGTDTPKALSQALQLKFNKFVVIFFNLPLDKSHYISGFLLRLPGHEFEVFFRSAVYQAAGRM